MENSNVYADWIGEAGITPSQSDIGVNERAVTGLLVKIEVVAANWLVHDVTRPMLLSGLHLYVLSLGYLLGNSALYGKHNLPLCFE
ncbi:MAG TPA: hypothetical protein VKP65_15175 [Rhodothermales bacterium]|nr:hypothetical protein [Rhodothermales bacterium]